MTDRLAIACAMLLALCGCEEWDGPHAEFVGDPELVGLAYRAEDELGVHPSRLTTINWGDKSLCWAAIYRIEIARSAQKNGSTYIQVRHECAELAVGTGHGTPEIQALLDSDHEANSP